MLADRVKDITTSGIRKIFDLASQMKNPINFSIGQADFDVPLPIKEAAIEAIRNGHNRYTVTQGIPELRAKVMEDIQKRRGISPEAAFITSGTSGGVLLAMTALLNPGDEVLLPDPYFMMYKNHTRLSGGVPKYYDLYPDFQLRPEEIEKQITEKTKIIMLNSPSNPTGAVFSREAIEKVAQIAKKYDILVMTDEIYDAFVYDVPYYSVASCYPKTIIFGGFSKTYGMPGWRMGFAAGPYEIIDKMITLQQFSYICSPTPLQYGTLKAFDVDMTPYIEQYKIKRDLIYKGLLEMGFKVTKPEGSFYIFPEVPWGNDAEFCEAAIKKELLIIPGSAFSSKNTHFRISFAVPNEVIEKGLEVLSTLIHEKK